MEQCPSLGCPGRTHTSDAVVPVHKGLPENQAPSCHQVLEAEDEGAKESVTKSQPLATLHTARSHVPVGFWRKRAQRFLAAREHRPMCAQPAESNASLGNKPRSTAMSAANQVKIHPTQMGFSPGKDHPCSLQVVAISMENCSSHSTLC